MSELVEQFEVREEQQRAQIRGAAEHIVSLIVGVTVVAVMALLIATIVYAQGQGNDKYSLKSPGGIAFSDFKGYEDWAVVSSSGPTRGSR